MLACSSSYLRKPPRQASSLVSSYLKTTASIIRDPITKPAPLLSTVKAAAASFSSSSSEKHDSSIKSTPPWLMLTPEIELSRGTHTVFKFYSLADDEVISIDRKNLKDQLGLASKKGVDLECMGSSHGWLVLLDWYSWDLFLYNPLSNRHLKLPSIRKLEAFEENYLGLGGYLSMTKVIISSSDPEGDANSRALMIQGDDDKLAFCCPKSSDEWTETHLSYNDVVCSGDSSMLFFGVDDSVEPYYPEFEGWDLKDVSRPMLISLEDRIAKDFVGMNSWTTCQEANFLVPAADGKNTIYYVCLNGGDLSRHVNEEGDYRFHVHKLDFESGKLVRMDRSLDGLALFVGRNHSFALSPDALANADHVKPNSIYFTHPKDIDKYTSRPLDRKQVKIYNYEDGTLSPPFYTVREINQRYRFFPPPMWYTPTCALS